MAALNPPSPLAARLGRLGLGCATFGREIDEAAAFAVMDYAWAHGFTHFDTAASYSHGASERIVGAWLAARRPAEGSVLVATKIKPPYTPDALSAAVTASCRALGVARLDLLYLHQWDEALRQRPTLEALDRLVRDGRVATLGASNLHAGQLATVLERQKDQGVARIEVLQNNQNFAVRDVDDALRQLCRREQISLVTYSPLGAGFLTGKHKSGVEPGSRFDVMPGHQRVYFTPQAWTRLAELEQLAARTSESLAHLALIWAMHQPEVASVLIGGRSTAHLDQALRARHAPRPAWLEEIASD